ncbi:hypothetical protein AVEN_196018-1 [Araneus ventricosus]|uniref:CCHC-type domain-containing protein n=1 Tax=Araneus ventricosus TaxID=182803 RepID=A0A4Y2DRL4_ARAVE|nr:hypothetical protein AVEN_196018-1 [Araneus ventricosus]
MSQLIARESEEVSNDYSHIKKLLLKRYKFSAEKFRQKFNNHTKSADSNWTDFLYELRNYFEEWLKGLEVKTFVELSDLIVTEQIKRRVPWEVKEHFIDEWADIKRTEVLAKRLDEYDSVRKAFGRKSLTVVLQRRDFQLGRLNLQLKVRHPFRSRRKNTVSRNQPQILKISKKRKTFRCYKCGSKEHIRPNCPLLMNKESSAIVNHLFEAYEDDVMSLHTSMGDVNGFPMPILRDTGSRIDVVCLKAVNPEMFTGEHVWVPQPLDDAPMCLPLAEVELKREFGHLITKAAVVCNKADKGRYLLGNRTAAIWKR